MAFSGTVSQTTFITRRVIDSAARRCKLTAQQISSEHIDIAKDQLYLLLSALANQGAPLWCLEKCVYPIYEGSAYITTYAGTVDIANASLRTLQQVAGTVTTTTTQSTTQFSGATQVTTVGIKWSGASVPLELLRSNDGSAWTSVLADAPSATAGEWTWYDIEVPVAAVYFRVLASTGTLDTSEIYLGNTPTEIPLARLNKDDYFNLPNKTFQSASPLQYWLDRKALSPVMRLWPAPSAAATHKQIVTLTHRHIMDVGTMQQQIEVPQRWLDAIIALLAARLAMEWVDVDASLIPMLDQKAAMLLNDAQTEESDDSPIRWTPDISAYTA